MLALITAPPPLDASEIIQLTNIIRLENHLPALESSPKLNLAAKLKADDMIKNHYWSHVSPSGLTPWYWFNKVNYQYVYGGENLAQGFGVSAEVVGAWMASPLHKENILSPNFCQIGIAKVQGVVENKNTNLIVQTFGCTK
ncbi:hypothetical protein KBC75_01480 [Candidatus Shapirobacteria bacterium]|nr:hypothetical protein [Candidatus Shapirobacteria bacterium]